MKTLNEYLSENDKIMEKQEQAVKDIKEITERELEYFIDNVMAEIKFVYRMDEKKAKEIIIETIKEVL